MLKNLKQNLRYRRGGRSYSQEGEDRVLETLMFKLHGSKHRKVGFYVDIGAHHPHRYSNTYLFYQRGWRGINVDALPGSMRAFQRQRPRDINLERGVGEQSGEMDFYVFNEPALNTFDASLAQHRCNDVWHVVEVRKVSVQPLSLILEEHLPHGKRIDFMSVDVEGFDLNVLASNDWDRYRPLVVLAETLGKSIEEVLDDPLYGYMKSLDYVLYSKTVNTCFFVDAAALRQDALCLDGCGDSVRR